MKDSRNMVFASIAFLALVYHLSNWGSQSLNIVFLKTAQVMNLATAHQYQSLQQICYDLKRYDCVEGAFKSQHISFEDSESLKKLALLQMRRGKDQAAVKTYQQYFESFSEGKLDKQSLFNYAKLLNKLGNEEEALKQYDKMIDQDKNVFSLSAVRNKMNILVKLNRHTEAKRLIRKYKALAKDDVRVTQEMNDIENQILNNS